MNVVGKVGSFISQGVYSVATPFHPFGGAVDVIVVQQQDDTFRSTPWYVQFGKFQGVLKGVEKIVRISVNGVEADFHMYLDNSGEAYFVKEVTSGECSESKGDLKEGDSLDGAKIDGTNDEKSNLGGLERTESDSGRLYYEFEDDQLSIEESVDNLDADHISESNILNSEVVLISVDGHILTAPISSMEREIDDDVQLSTPKFHLGPGQEADFFEDTADFTPSDEAWTANYLSVLATSSEVASNETCSANTAVKEHPCDVEENDNIVKYERESDVAVEEHSCDVEENDSIVKYERESGVAVEEHPCDVEENDSIVKYESESGVETNPEAGSINIRKDDIFKSCVDIPGLANQDTFKSCLDIPALVNHDRNSPVEIIEEVILVTASEGGDADSGVLINGEDLSRSCASLPIDVVYSNLPDEVDLTGECNSVGHIDSENSSVSCVAHEKEAELDDNELIGENAVTDIIKSDNTLPSNVTNNAEVEETVNNSLAVERTSLPGSEDISESPTTPSGRRWRLWPIPFRRVKMLEHTSSTSTIDELYVNSLSVSQNQLTETTPTSTSGNENKLFLKINVPTTEQIASLNLKEGQNMVTFSFCTRVLGMQQVEAHIYLWKWNARIVISDVDGTITKSDVLGQFMPLFGKDWTQSGVARLFCAIKENGYQLLFLSARAIVQAYLTRSFLNNIKQDGKALPTGPVVISPNGLFPSLYREVIRRAPQEFKIACLEDIKALFPPDYNPFYAGFGNRDTDELSYRKIGIPKGKIFIINPKGEVAISQHRIDVKSYTSLHTLVNDMFPPTSMVEQEDFNSWNFWRMPLPEID